MKTGEINLFISCVWIMSAGLAANFQEPFGLGLSLTLAAVYFWLSLQDPR